ncbi:UFD1-domain-containing protein [Coccomyxa subellipsoidea C-169]|uniref:UFD1-domain-containing protein n=1 Tax=Coccomyxa subellipsoidea (strain C-169) TaxID=574566 RepID=I0YZN2_COCSC|nr:UFD1-domain-containing protein [Coccomyxa subellipsoidea C-169]EIE23851.1 UFD1-domain-containing protein [Coccomyxa subellipsoidea C-169]|eukprot:XP_005648395.1 UFD1-domain-containing protein [Coccomyxa subellipsoidea C-169]
MGGGSFQAHYRCYPVSFMDKPEAETGNKIFLPSSALDRLASLHIEYPMLFKVESRGNGRSTHCGVLEFSADEGLVYMPYWMMQNLLVEEGSVVTVSSATLPKGSYVKLQPHTSDFLDISNPKAVLEMTLRNFSCLTKGDCICLHYNNKKYYIDIIEAKPEDAISVIETDCEVDFAPPLDYVEPKRVERAPEPARTTDDAGPEVAPEPERFLAFVGPGRRLDGRPAVGGPPVAGSSEGAAKPAEGNRPGQKSGKVVFGATGNRLLDKKLAAEKPKAPKPESVDGVQEKKDEDSKFKAFTGKPRSLRD